MPKYNEMQKDGNNIEDELLPSEVNTNHVYAEYEALVAGRPRINRIVQLYLTGNYHVSEIAEIIGVREVTIRKWLKHKVIMNYIATYQSEALEAVKIQMNATAKLAFGKLVELLDSDLDQVVLQASKDILDRTGFKPVTEVKQDITVKKYEEQLSDLIKMTMGAEDTDYVEVE